MYHSFFALILFFSLFSCQTTPLPETDTAFGESPLLIRYTPADVQKMNWLAGVWKGVEAGRPIRQSFQFHSGSILESLLVNSDGAMETCSFVWHEGRYYFGQNRQWSVTWIGEKDIRFDPVRADVAPMTWTRLDAQKWHLIRHTPGGDETTLMEATEEMHP